MRGSLKTALAGVTSALLLALLLFGRAAPANAGAARFRLGGSERAGQSDPWGRVQGETAVRRPGLPSPVSFREAEGRGLLVRTWVNGAGPFNFAIDTGAGATILSSRAP